MERGRECICCQCQEHRGQFADWYQCEGCRLYGSPDEYSKDPQGCMCDDCYDEYLRGSAEALKDAKENR